MGKNIIIAAILVAIAGAGIFLFYKQKHQTPQVATSTVKGWQTYSSSQNNFTVSYPEGWNVESCTSQFENVLFENPAIGSANCSNAAAALNPISYHDGNIAITVSDSSDVAGDIQNFLQNYPDAPQAQATVAGIPATKVSIANADSNSVQTDIVFSHANKVFTISNNIQTPGFSKTFDQFVASFKFTN